MSHIPFSEPWGMSNPSRESAPREKTARRNTMHIEPFSVYISEGEVEGLQRRLHETRWPLASPSEPWQRGVDANWLRELTRYWADGFDWRTAEHALNAQPQFTAQIEGQRVHFVHRRGVGPAPYPIVITHGWPGS